MGWWLSNNSKKIENNLERKNKIMSIEFLSIKEAADFLKAKPSTVRTWINRELIPKNAVKKIGRRVLIVKGTLEQHILSS